MISIEKVHIDYMHQPMGIVAHPQIGWVLKSDKRNTKQKSYRWQVAMDSGFEDILKDSQWVINEDSAHVFLRGFYLQTATKYYVRVMVEVESGDKSTWSEPNYFVTGILDRDEWESDFVSGETSEDAMNSKGTYVRKSFEINKTIKEAYVYSTALGLYNMSMNGDKVGEDEMAPGWTSYHKRLLYQTYEVTSQLKQGTNTIGAHLGAGWYKGLMGFSQRRNNYGTRTAFMAQMYIKYVDGTEEIIKTDETWRSFDSPVVFAEIYDGEVYDARLEKIGWSTEEFDDAQWKSVALVEQDKEILYSQPGSRVKIIESIEPASFITTPKGETVIDFGQNMAGWISFEVVGEKGDVVEVDCFEALDAKGNVYRDNLRKAKQKLLYTCRGDGLETYRPNFTFQGFRYAHIISYPSDPTCGCFTAHAVHSDMERTGYFECSNKEINQLQSNILWGLKSNFLDVPTDCPQRDERLGWTGDAQIFCRTASFLVNTHQFFSKWLKDLAVDQTPEGGVPHVVPDILTGASEDNWLVSQGTHSAAAWADAAVINPWVLYLTYGDVQIIHDQYDSMKAWIDFMTRHAEGGIWSYMLQFGDWVALDAQEGSYFGATPTDLTASAYYAYSTKLFAKMAKAIGKEDDYRTYNTLSEEIKKGFQAAFFDENGALVAETQTAHIVALYFDLTPEEYVQNITENLVKLIDKEDGHLVTGFIGTPYICHALSKQGRIKEAYDLLLKEDLPSWLYQVKMGATTIWEHWDGLKEDGTMWSSEMNSFNHYAYGAIGEWLYRVMAGLEIDEKEPGYKHALIQPLFGGDLSYVSATYNSIYGEVFVRWDIEGNEGRLQVHVPPNTKATIRLAQAKTISDSDGLFFDTNEGVLESIAGSGNYEIVFEL